MPAQHIGFLAKVPHGITRGLCRSCNTDHPASLSMASPVVFKVHHDHDSPVRYPRWLGKAAMDVPSGSSERSRSNSLGHRFEMTKSCTTPSTYLMKPHARIRMSSVTRCPGPQS